MPCALEVICMPYEQIKKRNIKKLHNWMTHISWFSAVKLFIFCFKKFMPLRNHRVIEKTFFYSSIINKKSIDYNIKQKN